MEHLDEFDVLSGFKFIDAYESETNCKETNEKGFATVIKFANDKHVAIDMILVDGELKLTEPYAVNDDYEPIDN